MQSMRTGYLVYVFQGDEERMKGNPERNWKLYGLWTHSSSPVVQYVSEKTRNLEDMMSLELLGYCISNDYKDDITRTMPHSGPLLIIENNGVELKAKIYKRNGLAPVSCFIKVRLIEFYKFGQTNMIISTVVYWYICCNMYFTELLNCVPCMT